MLDKVITSAMFHTVRKRKSQDKSTSITISNRQRPRLFELDVMDYAEVVDPILTRQRADMLKQLHALLMTYITVDPSNLVRSYIPRQKDIPLRMTPERFWEWNRMSDEDQALCDVHEYNKETKEMIMLKKSVKGSKRTKKAHLSSFLIPTLMEGD